MATVVPIVLAAGVTALSFRFSRRYVAGHSREPFRLVDVDAGPFTVGVIVILIAGLKAPSSTWSWFIDLCSFAVAASLVAVSKPGSVWRGIGLVVLGVHTAQVFATNGNAPFHDAWYGEVQQRTIQAAEPTWWPVIIAAGVVVASVLLTRTVWPSIQRRVGPVMVEADDAIMVAIGFIAMTIGGLMQDDASLWNVYVDNGAIAMGAILYAANQRGHWRRRVGCLMMGLHAAQVLVTDIDAPFYGELLQART